MFFEFKLKFWRWKSGKLEKRERFEKDNGNKVLGEERSKWKKRREI